MSEPFRARLASELLAAVQVMVNFTVPELMSLYEAIIPKGFEDRYLTSFLHLAKCVRPLGYKGKDGELIPLGPQVGRGQAIVYVKEDVPTVGAKSCAERGCEHLKKGNCLIAMATEHLENIKLRKLPADTPFIYTKPEPPKPISYAY